MNTSAPHRELVADYDLPQMPCTTPPRIHPYYPHIRALHAEWVNRHLPRKPGGALPRAIAHIDPMWDAMFLPFGDTERLFHHACLTSTNIELDDTAIAHRDRFDAVLGDTAFVEAESAANDDPYTRAYRLIWHTIRTTAPSERVYRRMRMAWRSWIDAALVENEIRAAGKPIDLDAVLRLRQESVCMRTYFVGSEYVLNIDAGDITTTDPEVLRAIEIGITHVTLTNDIYSYRKEYFFNDPISAIFALRNAHGQGLQQAIDTVYGMLAALDREQADLLERVHARYAGHPLGERLHQCFDNYRAISSGHVQACLETPRYNGRGYVWDGMRSRRVTVQSERLPLETV
ncbi:hypothetical protein J2W27_005768 [Variovorax boronicumulans]|uniref:terpene synthase family protein n=1 Tax=Variovorax boronicumulans TaxID=436515 RepID=UPI00278547FF|nr:terpene synthase family protein [Variovorax boronicumulans]MDP9913632.1 hypothetical protein [Variovorax boronicumulans]